jgi:hypothetical protein
VVEFPGHCMPAFVCSNEVAKDGNFFVLVPQ